MKQHIQQRNLSWAAFAAGVTCLSTAVSAQGLISTSGVVVAYSGDAVPDTTGTPIPGLNFLSNGLGNNCAVDESGNVFFLGQFTQVIPGDATNDRAYFYGSNRTNLKMVVRGADQAPGMTPGVLLRNAGTLSTGLSSSVKLTPNGKGYFSSSLWDNSITILSGNDSALFGGAPGSLGLLAQRGDPAPGCPVGVTFTQAFSSLSLTQSGINSSGRVYFNGALTGTGVVTTVGMNNQTGIFTGMPGALELVARKSDPAPGIPGAVVIDTGTSINLFTQMNGAGNILYDLALSTTQGTPPATVANNWALMQYTPGVTPGTGTSAVIVREGDPAPGTSPVATFNAVTGDAWVPVVAPNCWTRSNQTIFTAELRGGDVTTLPNGVVNDRAIYRGGVGGLIMVVRKGDPAPGTDAFFGAASGTSPWDVDSVMMNDSGKIVFNGLLTGGTSTTANDSGLWYGSIGSMSLIAREGSIEPVTGGTIGSFNITNTQGMHINDQGRLLYRMTLTGGTNPGNSLWLYEPNLNLSKPVVLPGNTVEVTTGVFKTIGGTIPYGEISYNNTDGASLTFMHNGKIGLRVTFSDSTAAIMTLDIPFSTPTTAFCLGDGTGAACPCANPGAAGRGCASSAFASGAILSSTGIAGASAVTDTLMLTATDIPGPGLFFQSSGLAGTPINFGDGLLCAAVGIVRLGVVFPAAGVATYPGGLTPAPIHIAGGTAAGDVRHYQCWYRSVPGLCNPQNFDLTQGLSLTWGP